jgi:hypothetical protein
MDHFDEILDLRIGYKDRIQGYDTVLYLRYNGWSEGGLIVGEIWCWAIRIIVLFFDLEPY